MTILGRVATCVLLAPLWIYRMTLSRIMPICCRFEPSCSAYAWEALSRHGALRGCWLTFKRLIRCQPFCAGGHDPVPD